MKQRYLKNFTGQKLLVIFMVICSSLINGKAISQTTYYVNDNNTTGDVLTSAVGSNSNSGTAAAPFATLTYGISQASVGDIIYVDAGSYNEAITINKRLSIIGVSSSATIFNSVSGGTVFTLNASGLNATARMVIKNLRLTGATQSGNNGAGIYAYAQSSPLTPVPNYVTIENVVANNNANGFGLVLNSQVDGTNWTDWKVINCTFSNNSSGFKVAGNTNLDGLVFDGCTLNSNKQYGIVVNPEQPSPPAYNNSTNWTIQNSSLTGNGTDGATSSGRYGNVNFGGYNGNITIDNITIDGQSAGADHGFSIGGRGNSTSTPTLAAAAAGTMSFSNITIQGDFVRPATASINAGGQGRAFSIKNYTDVSAISFSNVNLLNGKGNSLEAMGNNGTLNIGDMEFGAPMSGTIGSGTAPVGENDGTRKMYSIVTRATNANPTGKTNINATAATFSGLSSSVLANNFTTANRIFDAVDDGSRGYVNFVSGQVFVTTSSYDIATTTPSIQRGIDAATAGDVVNVDAGTYNAAISLNKSVALRGANYGIAGSGTRSSESIVSNTGGTAINITANGATVNGFNISGATAVSSTNVAATISNNIISASAMGISIGSTSTGYAVSNNAVTLSAQVAGSNPTVGISITGVSGTSAATISNNNISGAFYGYYIYSVNSSTASSVSGGTITGCANGIAAINGYNGVYAFVPSNVNISNITMSGFTGGNPQAGIYCFSGGSSNSATMTLNISGVNISGTDKSTADAAAMNFSDFSTASSNLQNITVTNCTISNNKNRGINLRGSHATASINANTISNNGYDAFVGSSSAGYGVIALEGATLNLNNNFITNPSSTTGAVPAYALCAATIPTAQSLQPTVNATENKFDNNGLTNGGLITSNGIINADCNWWGSTSQTAIAAKFQNSGTLDYTPWLNSGTDSDGSTAGFQPVSGACAGAPLSLTESHVNVICSGATTGSIDLTVSGGTSPFSYAWTKSGDVSYSASTQDLSNLASGTYTVVVTDANSITATTSIEITSGTVVYPVITNQPTKVGRKVALNLPAEPYTITVAANSALTYQWYSNTTASNSGGVLIAGATSNSYTPPTSTSYTAYFYCVVSNENSCSRASDVSEVFIVCN